MTGNGAVFIAYAINYTVIPGGNGAVLNITAGRFAVIAAGGVADFPNPAVGIAVVAAIHVAWAVINEITALGRAVIAAGKIAGAFNVHTKWRAIVTTIYVTIPIKIPALCFLAIRAASGNYNCKRKENKCFHTFCFQFCL